jgi:hypothetical protein
MNKEQLEQKRKEQTDKHLNQYEAQTKVDRSWSEYDFMCGFDVGVEAMQAEIESLKAEIAKRDELLNLFGVRLG